ncbi:MAG: hypothetical protein KKA60_06575 [Proteobacteria bacterium]|nr:hypothetical protein [Pseudomonadota bacterium]
MKKGIWIACLAVFMLAVWAVPGEARRLRDRVEDAVETVTEAEYGGADQSSDDTFLEQEDLARICFVQKDEDGADRIWIRVPPGMYRFAKARSEMKGGHGMVRIALRPRHYLAIEKATAKLPARVMLRISARRFQVAKGIKGHYIVRPLDQFMRTDPSDAEEDGE